MSDKPKGATKSKEAPSGTVKVTVKCGMDECGATGSLKFQGSSPHPGFTFEGTGWSVVEDMEQNCTVFLCPNCAKEFENEIEGDDGDADEDASN